MAEYPLLPPLPEVAPKFPLSERRGRDFTQEDYDEALGQVISRLLPAGLSAGTAALGGPQNLSIANVLFQLLTSQLPEGAEGVSLAGAIKRPESALGLAAKKLVSPIRRGLNLEGFLAGPGGQVVNLDEAARHYNLAAFQGTSIPEMLKRGFVRGRGNGVEIHSLGAADPEALALALRRAGANSPEVYLDTPTASMVYDTAELAANAWDIGRVRPVQRFLKESPW